MLDFIEPKPSKVLISLAKFIWPIYMKAKYGKLKIEPADDIGKDFTQLRAKPYFVCPNHSAEADADILFGVSRLAKERFNFLTARECFGISYSMQKKWLQMLGCYSIERGVADLHAFKATKELLLSGNRVVLFPEGEVSHQNDFLMTLENGAEHIALATQKELKNFHSQESVYILPLALKYRYSQDMRRALNEVLCRIEASLGLPPAADESIATRLWHAYLALVSALEEEHSLTTSEGSFNDRLFALRERMILEAELCLRVELPKSLSQLRRMHLLTNRFAKMSWARSKVGRAVINKDLAMPELSEIYYRQLKLAISLVAIGEHSFDHELTQEEAAELARVLEEEVCETAYLSSPDRVLIGTAKAIDVGDYYLMYERDKRRAIEALKLELSHRLGKRLSELEESYAPVMVGSVVASDYKSKKKEAISSNLN